MGTEPSGFRQNRRYSLILNVTRSLEIYGYVPRRAPPEGWLRAPRTPSVILSARFANTAHESGPTILTTPFYKMCARMAEEFLDAGSLLMILSQRGYARTAAQELSARLEITGSTDDLCAFLVERLGSEHPLIDCVRHGVAYHHAGLPVDVLDELEQAMRAETLRAMFATSTLTDGVNLPVRTVMICESRYPGQDPGQQLDGPRLLNAVGRAGRAGKETEGWIILGLNHRPRSDDFTELEPGRQRPRDCINLALRGRIAAARRDRGAYRDDR